jgi:hypothetical protein
LQKFFSGQEEIFDSSVLITQLDLKVKNLLTIANESKMTGFNYSSVDRADTYFVKLFAFYPVKRIIVYAGILIYAIERIANGLQPGMIVIG